MMSKPDEVRIDTHSIETYDKILSPEAQSRLKAANNSFGYDPDKEIIDSGFLYQQAHPLRVFGVLSLMTAESRQLGHGLKNGFLPTEVMDRHGVTDDPHPYIDAVESLAEIGLVVRDESGRHTAYYIHPDVGVGPVFHPESQYELSDIVVANEDHAELPNYIATLLPGLGDLITAAGKDKLFDRPLATGKAGLSVGFLLSLFAVVQLAAVGVTPTVELLKAAWLMLSVGSAATVGGLLQRGDLWLHDAWGCGS